MKILIIENGYRDLVKSRVPLGQFFISHGHEVLYLCPNPPEDSNMIAIKICRDKLALFSIVRALRRILVAENENSIDSVLSFRLVPNFLNYLASVFGGSKVRVAVITGLGYSFSNNKFSNRLIRFCIKKFYRIAEKRIKVISQNADDLKDLGMKSNNVVLGSGVIGPDENFQRKKIGKSVRLIFVGRLLKSKGIEEAVSTIENLRKFIPGSKLTIVGGVDRGNPDSVSDDYVKEIKNKEGIDFQGHVDDVGRLYRSNNILLYPSRYREGVPRVILEALSYGLTIITRDMPGCRETVMNNGLIVENDFVAEATDYICQTPVSVLERNAGASLTLFRESFSREVIFPQYLSYIQ